MSVDLEAIRDKIIVAPEPAEQTTATGIVIPAGAQKPSQQAEVVAVGEAVEDVAVGDAVLVAKHAGAELQVGDRELLVIRADDILAKVLETVVD